MKLAVLFFTLIIMNFGYAQKSFIAKDSALFYGIKILEGSDFSNSRICRQQLKNTIVEYSPDDISEYKTNSKRHYISKEISIKGITQKFFLEKLTEGDIKLFYLKLNKGKVFFIQKDSLEFNTITKKNIKNQKNTYKELLKPYCTDSNAIKHTKFTPKSLTLLIERQNFGINKPFPYIKYGLFGGVTCVKYLIEPQYESSKPFYTKFDKNLLIGIFADFPILLSYFSFHPEIYYTQNGFSEKTINYNTETDYLFKYSSLNIPLMFRYTYPSHKIRPFLEIGIEYSRLLEYEETVYKFAESNDIISISFNSDESIMLPNQTSLAGGVGVEFEFLEKYHIFIETRFINQLKIFKNNFASKNEFQFITGFNF